MKGRCLAGIILACWFTAPVVGYGTTVSIAVSYCPATASSSTSSSTSASTSTATPYYLYLAQSLGGQPDYVAADGTISPDPRQAVSFTITPFGQLMSGGQYVSTSEDTSAQKFQVSPTIGQISTVFSIFFNATLNRRDSGFPFGQATLMWRNDAFAGHQAIFCVFGSIVQVVFEGEAPPGCVITLINAIPAQDVQLPPTSSSTTALPQSSSRGITSLPDQSSSTTNSPISSAGSTLSMLPSETSSMSTSSTLILDTTTPVSKSTTLVATTTVSVGPGSTSSSTLVIGATTTSAIRTSMTGQPYSSPSSGIPSVTSSTSSGYPAPTTTGTPNCYDRSPFDGTVNNNYLILCDTDLPGYTLESVPASDIADCIDACNSFVPGSQGLCVAVAYDILAESNPCSLKYNISVVNRGSNAFAQAAILVNEPYTPEIVFANTAVPSSSTSTVESSTTTGTVSTDSSSSPSPSPSSSPTSSSTVIGPSPSTSTSPATTSNPASSTTPRSQSSVTAAATAQQGSAASTTTLQGSVASATSLSSTSQAAASSISTIRTTASSVGTTAASSLATTSSATNLQQSSSPVTTSSATILQQSSSATTSRVISSSSPVASPSSSPTSLSSLTTSPATSAASSNAQSTTSPGVSSSTSPAVSTSTSPAVSISTSTIVSISTTSRSSTPTGTTPVTTSSISTTTTTVSASSTTVSYCSGTPTSTSLCPAYNHQALNVNSDGICYEVECATTLQGNILNGNSTTASSLKTCISFCSLYNVALPYGCLGVNYLGAPAGSNPNCILLSTITGTSYNSVIDSGRLLYPGYPAVTDPVLGPTTTSSQGTVSTAAATVTTAASLTSAATSSSTTTTTTTALSCPAAPTASSCPGSSPYCYAYTNYGNTTNYEVECATTFTGAALQPILAFSLEDCVSWCQYQNILTANSCLGLTFQEGPIGQGTANNCFRYSSLTCATRGNATFDSARLIYSGYPQMTDYSGTRFSCI